MPRLHDLPAAGPLTGEELAPVFQHGETRRVSLAELLATSTGAAPLNLYGGGQGHSAAVNELALSRAFAAGRSPFWPGRDRLRLFMDFADCETDEQRWRRLKSYIDWMGSRLGGGPVKLVFPEGLTVVRGDSLTVDAGQAELVWGAGAPPDVIEPAGVQFEAVDAAAGRWRVSVALKTALPLNGATGAPRVVPGYPLGMQNFVGDGSAGALSGGLLVETVAADRKSFTALAWFRRTIEGVRVAPVEVEAPDTGDSDFTIARSRILVPRAAVAFTGGWDGRTTEGGVCFRDGGRGRQEWLGMAYTGPAGDGCTVFVKDHESGYQLEDRDVVVGGPERVFRVGDQGSLLANRACIGGGQTGGEVVMLQAGGHCRMVRSSIGGAFDEVFAGTDDAYLNLDACFVASGVDGVDLEGESNAILKGTRVSHCGRGVYAKSGSSAIYNAASLIRDCTTPLDWRSGGFHYGPPTLAANIFAPAPNTLEHGGGWRQDLTRGLVDAGTRVSPPPNGGDPAAAGVTEALIAGCGWLDIVGSGDTIDISGVLRVNASGPVPQTQPIDFGSLLSLGSGAIDKTEQPGFVTVSVYPHPEGGNRLRLVNNRAGSAVVRVYPRGSLSLSAFTQIHPTPPTTPPDE